MNSFNVCFLLAICVVGSSATPVKVGIDGKCPKVSFVEDFESAKFMGKWFAIKETGKEIPCVNYQLEETRPNHYHGFVLPQNFTIEFDKKNVDDFSEGLKVTFEVNPYMDGADLSIFATDYENYAGIFSCKEVEDIHYQTISFWSRTKVLSEEAINVLNGVVSKYPAINISYLKDVKQEDCEVVKKEVVKEEIVKDEIVKDEIVKDDVVKEEVVKDKEEIVKEEVVKEEVVKEEVVKDKEEVVKKEFVKKEVVKDEVFA